MSRFFAELIPDFGSVFGDKKGNVNITYIPSASSPILDDYSGALAAYSSTRQLKTGQTNCMRIRRDSDNTETDIGFIDGVINEEAINSFCSGGNGFVVTWYDQSGNGNSVNHLTAANQPKIYDSVTGVVKDNNQVALEFDGVSDYLFRLGLNLDYQNVFGVGRYEGPNPFTDYKGFLTFEYSSPVDLAILTSNLSNTFFSPIIINHYLNGGNETPIALPTIQSQFLIYVDTPPTSTRKQIYIGSDRSTPNRYWIGKIQEIIIFNTDQSANRTAIENNINNHYSIYV